METNPLTSNLSPIQPTSRVSQPVHPQPQPPIPPARTGEKFLPFILGIFAIITGIILFILLQQIQKKPEQPPPVTIIVTPTASPTPVRFATNISTSSAFTDLESSVASYAAKLSSFEQSDPSLSPPSIVLPLGFSN
jgi:hypothetical protein